MSGSLAGRHAVLTAAGSGLGRAAALRFAAEGARVVVSDLDEQRAAVVAEEIRAAGGQALHRGCDASKAADCTALMDAAESWFGAPVDLFLANAGAGFGTDFLEATEAQIRRTVDLNLIGSALSAQAALRSMVRAEGGCLLFTASLQSVLSRPQRSMYTATKHALVGLVKGLAQEFGPRGIRVNAVAPASTDTAFLRTQLEGLTDDVDAAVLRTASGMPLGHLPSPEDFAATAAFLAGPGARSITGQVIVVDCGASAGPFTHPKFAR
jgi:3-oxoacyl-[acyl-carrier protein] reductase